MTQPPQFQAADDFANDQRPTTSNDFAYDVRRTTHDGFAMTWVKICGITNLEDALVAVEAGADAVGFVFHEKSSRKIGAEDVGNIVSRLPNSVEKVGVFGVTSIHDASEMARLAGLSTIQVYGKESDVSREYLNMASSPPRPRLIYGVDGNTFPVSDGVHEREVLWLLPKPFATTLFALVVDCASGDQVGGTGNSFEWDRVSGPLRAVNTLIPIIVAGGLNASNVQRAMAVLRPWGVDVCSGVEARPGKKDPEKVRAFIKAVREADKANSRN